MPLTTRYGYADAPTSAIIGDSSLAWTTATASLSAAGTSLTVASSAAFPAALEFDIIIGLRDTTTGIWSNAEVRHVTAVSGTTWTVSAGSLNHASGESIALTLTASGVKHNPGALTDTGDMPYLLSTGRMGRLPAPSDGAYNVTWTSGVPSWTAAGSGGLSYADLATPPGGTALGASGAPFGALAAGDGEMLFITTPLDTPDAPTVTVQGTTGATTYGYGISALTLVGETPLSGETDIANGNATLNGTNYNHLTWPAVAGASSYRVYRLAGPGGYGLIGEVATNSANDQGVVVDDANFYLLPPFTNFTAGLYSGVNRRFPGTTAFGTAQLGTDDSSSYNGPYIQATVSIADTFTTSVGENTLQSLRLKVTADDGNVFYAQDALVFANPDTVPRGGTEILGQRLVVANGGAQQVSLGTVRGQFIGTATYHGTLGVMTGSESWLYLYGGTNTEANGFWSSVPNFGQFYGPSTLTNLYQFRATAPAPAAGISGSAITNAFVLWADDYSDAATNPYFLWLDSPAVFRVKGDGVMAYYNPTFTKYTPGAGSFERVVQQWNGNVLEYGTEVGNGSGGDVLRGVKIIGASLDTPATLTANGVAVATATSSTAFSNKSGNISQWTNDSGYLTSVTAHNLLSATHGDTTAGSVARGDVITGQGATPKFARLAKGTANQVLSMDGTATDVVWADAASGAPTNATYITQTANGSLSAEQALSSLSSGIMRVATTTGVITSLGDVLPVANGGTNASAASIAAFNNITGYSAAGATGTTSTNLVFSTSPTLVTPALGVATATSLNGNTFTTGTYTLTGAAGKTLTFSNSITLAGTDSTTMTFPSTSATIARTDAANTFTGHQTIEGVTSTGATGTGKFVFDGTPTLVTPVLGAATATSIGFSSGSIAVFNSQLYISFAGTNSAAFGQNKFTLTSAAPLGWSSTTDPTATADTFIFRGGAAATVQHGADVNGAAVAQTLTAANGITGTDKAGANFTITSGKGTGAGAVSSLIFQTPTALASGTTAQSLTTRLTIDVNGIKATGYLSSDGSAGVSAGPFTTITSITVKNGLVTALTGA